MAKILRMAACLCALMLLPLTASALSPYTVEEISGEEWYPSKEDWTYHYVYSCPRIVCGDDDPVGLLINDTLQMALDEMRLLALPMFAESPEMTASGPVTVTEEGRMMCNNGRFFSVLTVKCEERDGVKTWSLGSDTFDVGGEYPGETLTLRGVVMVGESSEQISAAVLPVLYGAFEELQSRGVCLPGVAWEEFSQIVIPTLDFYADENGSAVFYFQPSLLCEPGEDVPVFTFTPAELEALVGAMPAGEEER